MRAQNLIVHINAWPGTGKLTIARLLARRTGLCLVDNHTLINPAEMLFSRRDPLYHSLRDAVRRTVFDHIVRADPSGSFLFTDALSDDEFDTRRFEAYRDLAGRRGARIVAVVLDCSLEENQRRLGSPGREGQHKLTDPAVLIDLRSRYGLLQPRADDLIRLDVSLLDPDQAAAAIEDRLFSRAG